MALRVFTRHKDVFPQELLQLSSLDPTVANGPLHCKIEFLRDQIEYQKSVDATPISGPGVLQMDGASHGDHQPGDASRNITSQSPAGSAAAPAAAAAPSQGRMLQQKGQQSNQESNPVSADWPPPNSAAVEACRSAPVQMALNGEAQNGEAIRCCFMHSLAFLHKGQALHQAYLLLCSGLLRPR